MDAPINLQNDFTITSDSIIGFSWSDGLSDGGSPLIDYRILSDQSTGNFIILASGITDKFYTT